MKAYFIAILTLFTCIATVVRAQQMSELKKMCIRDRDTGRYTSRQAVTEAMGEDVYKRQEQGEVYMVVIPEHVSFVCPYGYTRCV